MYFKQRQPKYKLEYISIKANQNTNMNVLQSKTTKIQNRNKNIETQHINKLVNLLKKNFEPLANYLLLPAPPSFYNVTPRCRVLSQIKSDIH